MNVYLTHLRLVTQTSVKRNSNTDSKVTLSYFYNNKWYDWNLNNQGDDRELGQLDQYEFELSDSMLGVNVGGINYPVAVPIFADYSKIRNRSLYLEIHGNDMWRLDNYQLYGNFWQYNPFTNRVVEGWLPMAYHLKEFTLSTEESEGVKIHRIDVNGLLERARLLERPDTHQVFA